MSLLPVFNIHFNMKKTVLSLFAIFAFVFCISAQNSIQLNIHHKLANADFAFNEGAKNNMDNDFKVTRLQYYMSGLSFVHDGGTETALEDAFHVLVNANQATEIDLGAHDITQLEAIRFHIGVHPDFNHTDPASYGGGNPLAPSFPSMHWGWAAGYRFVAIEGKGGSSYDQTYELHGLGDANYYMTEIALDLTAEIGAIAINIDGDYTRVLENISVNSGVIVHGDYGDARKALTNLRDFVFSPSQTASSTIDFSEVTGFDVYPNPTTIDGAATVSISTTLDLTYAISVTDILGRQIQHFDNIAGNSNLTVQVGQPGIYLVNLIKNGQVVITQKLVSK